MTALPYLRHMTLLLSTHEPSSMQALESQTHAVKAPGVNGVGWALWHFSLASGGFGQHKASGFQLLFLTHLGFLDASKDQSFRVEVLSILGSWMLMGVVEIPEPALQPLTCVCVAEHCARRPSSLFLANTAAMSGTGVHIASGGHFSHQGGVKIPAPHNLQTRPPRTRKTISGGFGGEHVVLNMLVFRASGVSRG